MGDQKSRSPRARPPTAQSRPVLRNGNRHFPFSPTARKRVCPVRRVIRRSLTRKPKARLSQRQRALCDPHYGVRQHSAVTLSSPHWRIGFILFYSFTMTLSYRVFGNPCEGAMHFRARTNSRGQCGLDRSNAPRFSWSRRLARPFWRWPRQGGPWIKAALRLA